MKMWVGAVAVSAALAIWDHGASAGVLAGPAEPSLSVEPLAVGEGFSTIGALSFGILPEAGVGARAFESLGVMTLLEPPSFWPEEASDSSIDLAALATNGQPGVRFEQIDLPSVLSEIDQAKSGSPGILDVIFVIPTPGSASLLLVTGAMGARRRRGRLGR